MHCVFRRFLFRLTEQERRKDICVCWMLLCTFICGKVQFFKARLSLLAWISTSVDSAKLPSNADISKIFFLCLVSTSTFLSWDWNVYQKNDSKCFFFKLLRWYVKGNYPRVGTPIWNRLSLRGVHFGFWSRLGCSGESANISCRQGPV